MFFSLGSSQWGLLLPATAASYRAPPVEQITAKNGVMYSICYNNNALCYITLLMSYK